jgi:hypothetical protein
LVWGTGDAHLLEHGTFQGDREDLVLGVAEENCKAGVLCPAIAATLEELGFLRLVFRHGAG